MPNFKNSVKVCNTKFGVYGILSIILTDIQLQHSIITAQKETVLKSRQKTYDGTQRSEPSGDQTHMVHMHAGTVLQHRGILNTHFVETCLHMFLSTHPTTYIPPLARAIYASRASSLVYKLWCILLTVL
jgi:hypothetical protein